MDDLLNFRNTLSELKSFVALPIENNRERAGIVQAFEFTFEQAWKAIQRKAGTQGVEIGNPKAAFQYAMQNQWISKQDEEKWLGLLRDRKLTSHTYQQTLAYEVIKRISSVYLQLFSGLLGALEKAN